MKLVVGNWKMNGVSAQAEAFDAMVSGVASRHAAQSLAATAAVCPPATLLFGFAERAAETPMRVGAQDCHAAASGAHTGDVSAEMLRDAGADFVIVGHSERRADHGETDATVRAKAEAARRAGLTAILCVGETLAERDAGRAVETTLAQLEASAPEADGASALVVAYEPVWAIGTGRSAGERDVAEMHGAIKQALRRLYGQPGETTPVLYGGSVKPENAAALFKIDGVDGALVGGASLQAASFLAILDAAA